MLFIGADEELYSESRGVPQATNYLADESGRRLDVEEGQVGLTQSSTAGSPTQGEAEQALPPAPTPSRGVQRQQRCCFCSAKSTRGEETSPLVPSDLQGLAR